MTHASNFYRQIRQDYDQFLAQQATRFPSADTLRIDLHCHDHNSDIPDELWGRLLGLPETWLPTDQLVQTLNRNKSTVITITNHNNARSCWALLDQGLDILVGGEFTCHFPQENLSIHVLVYGFTPEQEATLNRLRHNIYDFLRFARAHALPVVQPHPLFFYTHKQRPTLELLEKFAVLFQRFEVLNGQRGYWQNQLTRCWVDSLTPERVETYARKHQLNPEDFNPAPFEKALTGGSDDHNGIFAGRTGTLLHIPDLNHRLTTHSRAELAKEALWLGQCAPFGEVGEEEKLTTTFLDYFSQVALNMQDPGLLRLMLHKGTLQDKLSCLAISNGMQELKRHKYTLTFLQTFHEALHGTKPKLLTQLGVSKAFKPVLKTVKEIARTQRKEPERFLEVIRKGVPDIYQTITGLFFERLNEHLNRAQPTSLANLTSEALISRFEVPTHFRALLGDNTQRNSRANKQSFNLAALLDATSFPALASLAIAGASFAASQVIYANRPFLNTLANHLQQAQHPQRVLWLTDSFADKNGVSSVLQSCLAEIQRADLPIDLLTCHPTLEPQAHLHVLRPVSQFHLTSLAEQTLYVPDMLALQHLFEKGGYDRVLCSTELLMGPAALYLKHAFSVPAHFYMHTDWLTYAQYKFNLNVHEHDRFRRLLRTLYQQFDGIFVLNDEHRRWLASEDMAIAEHNIKLTRHWVDPLFNQPQPQYATVNSAPILLYVGRLSEEKGVLELPAIFNAVRQHNPHVQCWIAGQGPAQKQLAEQMPDASFLGWVAKEDLPALYQKADMLLMPSRFDTFGCAVLEAMSSGTPVAAYRTKGPADIITHLQTGYLADTQADLIACVKRHCAAPISQRQQMRSAAYHASLAYRADQIMADLLRDLGLQTEQQPNQDSDLGEFDQCTGHISGDTAQTLAEYALHQQKECEHHKGHNRIADSQPS